MLDLLLGTTPLPLVRRIMLLGLVAAVPGAVRRVARVGFLSQGVEDRASDIGAFREGLQELGWREGETIVLERRFADGQVGRLPDLAGELVVSGVDVIVATSSPAIAAAMQATTSIPIV